MQAHGYPTTKHEDWRYTKIDPALAVPLDTGDEDGRRAPSLPDLPAPPIGGPRVVVVNGRVDPARSTLGSLPGGVRVEALGDALRTPGEELEALWSWPLHTGGYSHALRALNDVWAFDAVVIDVPPGTVVEEAIEVVVVNAPGAPRWSHPRLMVIAGPGSGATLVESYVGSPGAASVTNALTQVRLGDGACLAHYVLQDESPGTCHFSGLEAHLGRQSRLSSCLFAAGGRIGRHESHVVLAGEDAALTLDGLFLTGDGQHHDNVTFVDHAATRCRSHQLYKGAVAGDGHGVFNGHLVVRPGADGTDATQVNKNLLVSDQAEIDTRPRLEIFADDVACSHGAAVGQLDPDALFYLRSRGVPERTARALLVSGFLRDVLDRFAPGPIRQRAEDLARKKMAPWAARDDDGSGAPGAGRTPRRAGREEG